ncbi:MAG: MBL fold metallo-hydrolase [Pseudomonadota bacterium]
MAGTLSYPPELFEGELELGAGVTVVPTPGHTPGHSILRVASGDDQVLLLGDLVPNQTIQFARPDIRYVLDVDHDEGVKIRRCVFDMLASDAIPFFATNMTETGFVRLKQSGNGFVLRNG